MVADFLPHYVAPQLIVTPLEFRHTLWHEKTNGPYKLLLHIVLVVLTQSHRTDGQMDGYTKLL